MGFCHKQAPCCRMTARQACGCHACGKIFCHKPRLARQACGKMVVTCCKNKKKCVAKCGNLWQDMLPQAKACPTGLWQNGCCLLQKKMACGRVWQNILPQAKACPT